MSYDRLITWKGMNIPLIEDAYNKIAPAIAGELCDRNTREKIKSMMKSCLPDYNIKCDEENNPPML